MIADVNTLVLFAVSILLILVALFQRDQARASLKAKDLEYQMLLDAHVNLIVRPRAPR